MIVTSAREGRYVELVRSFPVLGGRTDLGGGSLGPAFGITANVQGYISSINLNELDAWGAQDPDAWRPTVPDHDGELRVRMLEGRGPFPGDGAVEAVRFVLALWSDRHAWRVGKFDLWRAFRVWDTDQLSAFRAYVNNPFRP